MPQPSYVIEYAGPPGVGRNLQDRRRIEGCPSTPP